jgi:hypothetical protein
MEELAPSGMWLQRDGCCMKPSRVAVEFNPFSCCDDLGVFAP